MPYGIIKTKNIEKLDGCSFCGEIGTIAGYIGVNGDELRLCEGCYDSNFVICDKCGNVKLIVDCFYNEIDSYYCKDCKEIIEKIK